MIIDHIGFAVGDCEKANAFPIARAAFVTGPAGATVEAVHPKSG
jgi:hypothetical protein